MWKPMSHYIPMWRLTLLFSLFLPQFFSHTGKRQTALSETSDLWRLARCSTGSIPSFSTENTPQNTKQKQEAVYQNNTASFNFQNKDSIKSSSARLGRVTLRFGFRSIARLMAKTAPSLRAQLRREIPLFTSQKSIDSRRR